MHFWRGATCISGEARPPLSAECSHPYGYASLPHWSHQQHILIACTNLGLVEEPCTVQDNNQQDSAACHAVSEPIPTLRRTHAPAQLAEVDKPVRQQCSATSRSQALPKQRGPPQRPEHQGVFVCVCGGGVWGGGMHHVWCEPTHNGQTNAL